MKILLVSLLCAMFIGCSSDSTITLGTVSQNKPILPKRIEVISATTEQSFTGFYVIKDNVTGNEYFVGRATEAISIVPIITTK